MIDTRTLAVGDFVLFGNTPHQINAVHKHKVGYHNSRLSQIYYRREFIKGIPLSTEIIEKCVAATYREYFKPLGEDENGQIFRYYIYGKIDITLRYVHELQRICKLIHGEDKLMDERFRKMFNIKDKWKE